MDPTVGGIIAAALAAGGGLLTGRWTSHAAQRANADGTVLAWAKQLQESEAAARRVALESEARADRIRDEADADVKTLRGELDGLSRDLRGAQLLARELTDTLAHVQLAVWRDPPDVAALRRLIPRPDRGQLT